MSNFRKLDSILRSHGSSAGECDYDIAVSYAEAIARIECAVVVLSDLSRNVSRIFTGGFAQCLGIEDYLSENSIWESAILDLMPEADREEKYLSELRYFNYVSRLPRKKRDHYCLASHLHMKSVSGKMIDVLHRMFYIYGNDSEYVKYALCTYGPLSFIPAHKSVVVNQLTGVSEPLGMTGGNTVLTIRERQVLSLISKGNTSEEIAALLCLSRNTVSRHRQSILGKLRVKNSLEACRVASQLGEI